MSKVKEEETADTFLRRTFKAIINGDKSRTQVSDISDQQSMLDKTDISKLQALDQEKPVITREHLHNFLVAQRMVASVVQVDMLYERIGGHRSYMGEDPAVKERKLRGIQVNDFVKAMTPSPLL